jgi:DNA repair protein RadD
VLEALERQNELKETAEISVRPDGRYWSVVGHRVADNDNVPSGENDNYAELLDDSIPF